MQQRADGEMPNVTHKAVLLLLAIALSGFEAVIPRIPFLPWLKPGLANITTIIWVIRYGTVDAMLFTLLRTWIVGFYFGFSFLTLALSTAGGVCATMAMGVAWALLGRPRLLGLLGLGIIGALFHNAGQITAVYFMMARNQYLFYQLPLMLIASVVFGGIVGVLAHIAAATFDRPSEPRGPVAVDQPRATPVHTMLSGIILAFCVAVMAVGDLRILGIAAVAASVAVQLSLGFSPRRLANPLTHHWLLFLFVAVMYLFPAYGRVVPLLPFITYDGLTAAACQCLRLWVWLQLSLLLMRTQFHRVVLAALQRMFPSHGATIGAGLIALERFPEVVELVKKKSARGIRRLAIGPRPGVREALSRLRDEVQRVVTQGTVETHGVRQSDGDENRPSP